MLEAEHPGNKEEDMVSGRVTHEHLSYKKKSVNPAAAWTKDVHMCDYKDYKKM